MSIKWDSQGENYLILCEKSIAVFSIGQDEAINVVSFDVKVVDFAFIGKQVVSEVMDEGASESEQQSKQSKEREAEDVNIVYGYHWNIGSPGLGRKRHSILHFQLENKES